MATILPDGNTGWACPCCGTCYAPSVPSCAACGPEKPPRFLPKPRDDAWTGCMSPSAVGPILPPPDPWPERGSPDYCWKSWPPRHTDTCGCNGEPATFTHLAVPSEMMQDNYVKVMRFGTEWTEVMPGLQVRAREINAKDGWMRADFRLTPQGGGE